MVSCSTGRRLHGFHHFFGHELNNGKSRKSKKADQLPLIINIINLLLLRCKQGSHSSLEKSLNFIFP